MFDLYILIFPKRLTGFGLLGSFINLKDVVFQANFSLSCKIFFKNRKQRTVLNGQCSTWGDILAGVPQGSILAPLLFRVYINDLTANLKCNVKLFADDTSLFTIVHEPNLASEEMNHDLPLISQWAHDWRMSFNPDPQKQAIELLFTKKRHQADHSVILYL